MTKISTDAYDQIKEAYIDLKEMLGTGSLPIVLMIAKKKSNDRSKILRDSAIDSNYIDDELKNELIDGGYVQTIANTSQLSLTAKGVWTVESKEEGTSIEDLISGIDDLYYNEFKGMRITSSNKIVVFAMISMRTFSENSTVDVKLEKNVSEYWWKIFLEVNDFLLKMGVISEKDSLRKEKPNSGIEDKASNLIRHSDKLPRYTYDVFSKSGKNQYWLELTNEKGNIDTDKLAFLIKQILRDSITDSNCDEYWKFANNLCLDHRYEVESSYDDEELLSCEYDSDIRRAFKRAVDIQIN